MIRPRDTARRLRWRLCDWPIRCPRCDRSLSLAPSPATRSRQGGRSPGDSQANPRGAVVGCRRRRAARRLDGLNRAIPPVNPANPKTTGTPWALSAPFAGAMVPGAAARSVRDALEVRHAAANLATGGSRACVSTSSTDSTGSERKPADVRRHVVEIAPVALVDAEPRRMASHSRERDARRFLHDVAELPGSTRSSQPGMAAAQAVSWAVIVVYSGWHATRDTP
jgi:hypothetical protein